MPNAEFVHTPQASTDRERIEAALSAYCGRAFHIEAQKTIGGGCINDAYRITGSGHNFFLKANAPTFFDAFTAEAEALHQLAATRTARVPEVVAAINGDSQSYLILEYIEPRPSRVGDWAKLGRQLAKLHSLAQPSFGWHRDNYFGATPQANATSHSWRDFFRDQRIKPLLRLCEQQGHRLPQADRLLEKLPDFFADHSPVPSLLHGDLWSGNVSFAEDGSPFLYDPASYHGDREADLAFTEFFGGFPPAFYEAYEAELPLAEGYPQRKTLYNLYHCLNHLHLFGASYAEQAEGMTRQLLAR